jgi:peptide-methionine (R)-S-oxide reductase
MSQTVWRSRVLSTSLASSLSAAAQMSSVPKSDAEWRALLSPDAYRVTRLKGTERPFTSPITDDFRSGSYKCVCCGAVLFL